MSEATVIPRQIGTMGGNGALRLADDAYYSDPRLAKAICLKLRETIGIPGTVIEPSAGIGAFVRAASETWDGVPVIHAIEPHANVAALSAAGAHIVRAFRWEDVDPREWRLDLEPEAPVLILGNPPFLLAEDHVRLAMKRLCGGSGPRYLSLLLRSSFLAGQDRVSQLFDGPEAIGGLRYVWNVVGRPSFADAISETGTIIPAHTPRPQKKGKQPGTRADGMCVGSDRDGREASDSAEYSNLVWEVGYRGDYSGGWLRWR